MSQRGGKGRERTTKRNEENSKGDKMKTKIVFAVRCNPSKTQKKLEKIEGSGTAYITELSSKVDKNRFKQVENFDQLVEAAKRGADVIYKTASLFGASKFYVKEKI